MPEDGGSPSESYFHTLKLRLHDMKICGVSGLMSCCCSVEELCPVKESCLCNLTPWAFWVGPRPVIPLQLHPDVGLERIFGPRITTTNSMDTVDSRGPEWLPWIFWALCVKLTSPACCLALTNCLLQRLNHQLSQNNGIFPDFAWDLAQAYVLLWYTHAWKPNLKRKKYFKLNASPL